MAHEAIASLLEDNKGGVWFLPAPETHVPPAAAKKAGFAFFHIEGSQHRAEGAFLNHVATPCISRTVRRQLGRVRGDALPSWSA